jgi:hypothetical protein
MTRKRFLAFCALALTGAFAGSYLANRAIRVARAQGGNDLRATSFTLVDAQGNTLATFRNGRAGAELALNTSNDKSRIEISATGGITIRDRNGRVTWSSPRMGTMPIATD